MPGGAMTLEQAIVTATKAHAGEVDKGGQPYILHPLRVMLRMKTERERIVAVLHDVVEDTDVTLAMLRNDGLDEECELAVDTLTRRDGETYADFIGRIAMFPLAARVKLADLADNSDPARLAALGPEVATGLAKRYAKATARLIAVSGR